MPNYHVKNFPVIVSEKFLVNEIESIILMVRFLPDVSRKTVVVHMVINYTNKVLSVKVSTLLKDLKYCSS